MEKSNLRLPVVAGKFYPGSKDALNKLIASLLTDEPKKSDVIACMLPHAGYIYSGAVAVKTVSRMNIRDRIILLGPNHTGYGERMSIMTEGAWQTPLGKVSIDTELAQQILAHSKYLKADYLAQADEHSLEVELPILQYFKSDFKIVPIVLFSQDAAELKELGQEIASAIEQSGGRSSATIIASSDMTHYESQSSAQKKDKEALQAVLALDEDKLMERVQRLNISMCGCAPVTAMLSAAKALGATQAELVSYKTSGDVTGDTSSVVGYAGVIIY